MSWRLTTSRLSCQSSCTCEHCPESWSYELTKAQGLPHLWFPMIQRLRNNQFFSSIAEVLVLSEYTYFSVVAHCFLPFLSVKLRDWNTASLPVINEMLSRDIFLDHTAPSHCSKRMITLTPDPWLLSPFSPPSLDTSIYSIIVSDGTANLFMANVSGWLSLMYIFVC